MDIKKLVRRPEAVHETLVNKDHQLITKTGCKILVPEGYVGKGLASISSEVTTIGIWMMVINDKHYAVSIATSMMNLTPSSIEMDTIEEEDFYVLHFDPGSVVIRNTELVKDKKIVNYIMDYFTDYGHSPWFIKYIDHSELFVECRGFNDITLVESQAMLDIVTAHISRDPNDIKQYYRHTLKDKAGIHKRPLLLPLRDIANNTTSNLARLNGSEMKRSIKASLTNEPVREEPLETIIAR